MNRLLKFLIRKLVTLYYKRTHFLTYCWGVNEIVDINILSEESTNEYHRIGTRVDFYEVEE